MQNKIDKKVLKLILDWFTVYISVLNGFINRLMRKNVLSEIHIQKISRVH